MYLSLSKKKNLEYSFGVFVCPSSRSWTRFFYYSRVRGKTILCLPWSVCRVNLEQHRWCFPMCFYSLLCCKTSSVVWLYLIQGISTLSGDRAVWLGRLKKDVVTQCPWESPFRCGNPVSLNWIGIMRHWAVWQPTAGVKAWVTCPKQVIFSLCTETLSPCR